MKKRAFYGRQQELARLRALLKKRSASLVCIKGRRRIGKSRLVEQFAKGMQSFFFMGLPPDDATTAQSQREVFVKQMEALLGTNDCKADDWGTIFFRLAREVAHGRIVLVFDEINWIGSKDHAFLGQLKTAWDLYFKQNPELIMVLSGSMSAWIDENILKSAGFMGRFSLELTLEELPLIECNKFWSKGSFVSAYDKFMVLSVTGGVPRYLEEIDTSLSGQANIQQLAFRPNSLFVEEFDRIFTDLFSRRSKRYKDIIRTLVDGPATFDKISREVSLEKGGTLSAYLEDLVETGYVAKDVMWHLNNGQQSRIHRYRLRDNYVRFYLKVIQPHLARIEKDLLKKPVGWDAIMGLQFENLIIHNELYLLKELGIDTEDVIQLGPYFQRPTTEKAGCQIDFMIQTSYNTLYVCEIKFSRKPIGPGVIKDVREKIARLARPKGFSVRPVIIQVNGVTDSVIESGFFAASINVDRFLKQEKSADSPAVFF